MITIPNSLLLHLLCNKVMLAMKIIINIIIERKDEENFGFNIIYYLLQPTHFPVNIHFARTESYSFSNIKVFIYTTAKIQLDKNFTIEVIPLILQKRRMNFCDWKRTSKKFPRNNILLCIQVDIIGTFRFSFYKSFLSRQVHVLLIKVQQLLYGFRYAKR